MLAQAEYEQSESIIFTPETNFLERIDSLRSEATASLNKSRQGLLGQFFTPLPIARMMASMIDGERERVHILDAGAGMGVLTAAVVAAACKRSDKPKEIAVTAVELDTLLIPFLQKTLEYCRRECERNEIEFTSQIINENFVSFAARNLSNSLFTAPSDIRYDLALLNPPYGKINTNSETNRLLRQCGIVAPNLYAAFLALSADMLAPGGEIVAITPRSFCNGTYFRPFRQYFLEKMSFRRFHVFDSRKEIFDDDILQENIIFHAVKNKSEFNDVVITTSHNGVEGNGAAIKLKSAEVVRPDDEELYIHLGREESGQNSFVPMQPFSCSLDELGLKVSTGRVVDFRAKEFLQNELTKDSVPLIYPHNLQNGIVQYPVNHTKKFDSIRIAPETGSLLVETGTYVLVKRFSAKEERKRITASLFESENAPGEKIGFENHLNYFHGGGQGIDSKLAKGLTLYLNSTMLDAYFRRFSGHTQVNATDLRYLKYPTRHQLETISEHFTAAIHLQDKIDSLIDGILPK